MNIASPPNPFLALWAMGYGPRLVPIIPPDASLHPASVYAKRLAGGRDARGKAPGARLPNGDWRGDRSWLTRPSDEHDAARWHAWGAGVGIRTGEGLAAFDADCLTEMTAAIARSEVERRFGVLPTRQGRAPKIMYVCRTDENFKKYMFEFGDLGERIEILGSGCQFVAHGVHPQTHKPYKWLHRLPPYDELPIVRAADLRDTLDALRVKLPKSTKLTILGDVAPDVDQAALKGDPRQVVAAVSAMANTNEFFPLREDYLNVGYAIKAALADDPALAFETFWGWCDRWTGGENARETVESDWARMRPPFRVGAEWLFETAARTSGGAYSAATRWFDDVGEADGGGLFGPEPEGEASPTLFGTPFVFPEPSSIPPREFLYGSHYLRQYMSATIAPTKVGKSSLGIVEALAMASGKPLLGVQPTGVYRVRIWNGEDPIEEMTRRVVAAMRAHGLTPEDIGDRLLLDSGRDMPICVAIQTRDGARIVRPVADALLRSLEIQKVDAMIVDPYIKSHRVSENDNNAVDAVAREWNVTAGIARIALDLVHHTRKLNGDEISIDDSRGASALVSAARSARVLARMTRQEGERWRKSRDYKRFFRFADASSNMALPALDDDAWMELRSIDLGNARFDAQGRVVTPGDAVGVVFAASLGASLDADAEVDARERALAELARGDWRSDPQARDAWAGVAVARAYGFDIDTPEGKSRAKDVIKDLVRSGRLIPETRRDNRREMRGFYRVGVEDIFS